jgi:hypothetical protein
MMAETITVQLGSYANFVGSHYWNIQVGIKEPLAPLR